MADNATTTRSPEEEALQELLEGGGEKGSGKEEVSPPPAPAPSTPPKEKQRHRNQLHEAQMRWSEYQVLLKVLPEDIKAARQAEHVNDEPKPEDTFEVLQAKENVLRNACISMTAIIKALKQVPTVADETNPSVPQPTVQKPPAPTEPEWEALPLWAKWTISGVGSAVILGVIAWVFYAVVSM